MSRDIMSYLDRQHWCPVCNSQVRVVSSSEGTMHYQSITREQALRISKQTLFNAESERKMAVIPVSPSEQAIMDEVAEVGQLRADLEAAQAALAAEAERAEQLAQEANRQRERVEIITNVWVASKQYHARVIAKQDDTCRELAAECERLRVEVARLQDALGQTRRVVPRHLRPSLMMIEEVPDAE